MEAVESCPTLSEETGSSDKNGRPALFWDNLIFWGSLTLRSRQQLGGRVFLLA